MSVSVALYQDSLELHTQATNSHDPDCLSWLNVVRMQSVKYSHTSTLQRSRCFVRKTVWDLEEEGLTPDRSSGHASLVKICVAVHCSFGAIIFASGETPIAVATAIMLVAPSYTISLFQISRLRTDFLNNSNTLVA